MPEIREVATRADAEHEAPAIGDFLNLLEADIRTGRHVVSLPDELARAMLANAGRAVNLDEEIAGDVAIWPSDMAGYCCFTRA